MSRAPVKHQTLVWELDAQGAFDFHNATTEIGAVNPTYR